MDSSYLQARVQPGPYSKPVVEFIEVDSRTGSVFHSISCIWYIMCVLLVTYNYFEYLNISITKIKGSIHVDKLKPQLATNGNIPTTWGRQEICMRYKTLVRRNHFHASVQLTLKCKYRIYLDYYGRF